MTLSLDAIYRPLNAFFVGKFGPADGAPVTFRFSRMPRTLLDSDFVSPVSPELGPSPAIAQELLSDLVDGVARLDDDGRTVWLSTNQFSELYHDEILGPAQPFVPADTADAEARLVVFEAAKAEGLALWEKVKAVSLLQGPGVWVRLSTALPRRWWDKTAAGVWTAQTFQVKGAATTSTPSTPTRLDELLRLKLQDDALRPILLAQQAGQAGAATKPTAPVATTTKPAAPKPAAPKPSAPVATTAKPTVQKPITSGPIRLSTATLAAARPLASAVLSKNAERATLTARVVAPAAIGIQGSAAPRAAGAAPPVSLHDDLKPKLMSLPVRQRFELEELFARNAPKRAVTTNNVQISFEYCLVSIKRPWLHEAFLNNRSWCVLDYAKGQLSANDGHGATVLPVGFVAIKNLRIVAPWTAEDIQNLERSEQFGPFNFDSKVVGDTISHPGMQVVGVLLQDLPDLPPNDAG